LIRALLVAALVLAAGGTGGAAVPADIPPLGLQMGPAGVLARYEAELAAEPTPRVVSFQYTVEQIGARDLMQQHHVFRAGLNVRDEIIAVDGKPLAQPVVRIAHGRRNRYAVESLAPRASAYAFRYVGPVRDGRHTDYVFATTPRTPSAFRVTRVTIDGASYLPATIDFTTSAHDGSGSISFVRADRYWVPALATARATYAKLAARERISFSLYRFPTSLPAGTFAQPHPAPALKAPTL
jgi:hypothetical protein